MTGAQFVKALEAYYEQPYRSKFKVEAMLAYLGRAGVKLDILLELVLKGFKGQYGKLPDIAAIEDILADPENAVHKRLHVDEGGKVWSLGQRIGHYEEGRFIPYFGAVVPTDEQLGRSQSVWGHIEYLERRALPEPAGVLE